MSVRSARILLTFGVLAGAVRQWLRHPARVVHLIELLARDGTKCGGELPRHRDAEGIRAQPRHVVGGVLGKLAARACAKRHARDGICEFSQLRRISTLPRHQARELRNATVALLAPEGRRVCGDNLRPVPGPRRCRVHAFDLLIRERWREVYGSGKSRGYCDHDVRTLIHRAVAGAHVHASTREALHIFHSLAEVHRVAEKLPMNRTGERAVAAVDSHRVRPARREPLATTWSPPARKSHASVKALRHEFELELICEFHHPPFVRWPRPRSAEVNAFWRGEAPATYTRTSLQNDNR
mmetsp:Transcript_4289/g.11092  ORF Transcript_4289/g.11092 Transcript_4289/m.11092 type:complete len:296 (+) Transcript_4289:301-1188(+)